MIQVTIGSDLLGYLVRRIRTRKGTEWFLGMLGGFLVGAVLWHGSDYDHGVVFAMLGGYVFQMVAEHFTAGIEHLHPSIAEKRTIIMKGSVALALFLHAFIEGIPVWSVDGFENWVLGIYGHRFVEGMLVGIIASTSGRRWFSTGFVLITVCSFLPVFVLNELMLVAVLPYLKGFAMGALLYIGSMLIRELGTEHHRYSLQQVILIVAGMLLAVLTGAVEER